METWKELEEENSRNIQADSGASVKYSDVKKEDRLAHVGIK